MRLTPEESRALYQKLRELVECEPFLFIWQDSETEMHLYTNCNKPKTKSMLMFAISECDRRE